VSDCPTVSDWAKEVFNALPDESNIAAKTNEMPITMLPSLDVVAVSQAPSPGSSPNPPLPVVTMAGQDPAVES